MVKIPSHCSSERNSSAGSLIHTRSSLAVTRFLRFDRNISSDKIGGQDMSLHVLNAHTGRFTEADPCVFSSLEELRSWIAQETRIGTTHQILMTARGKQVRIQNISEQEIFLYDRRVLAAPSLAKAGTLLPKERPPTLFRPETAPKSTANDDSLQAWRTLFKRRRAWAIGIVEESKKVTEAVSKLDRETQTVKRGAAIAVGNIEQHVANLRSKYQESKTWADQICDDQAYLLGHWQHALGVVESVPANEELGQCLHDVNVVLRKRDSRVVKAGRCTLRSFVAADEVKAAAASGERILRNFADRLEDLNATFDDVVNQSSKIIDKFQQSMDMVDSDASDHVDRLMEEIEVLTKKINADYEHVLGLADIPKSALQASKVAHLHKNNLLPSFVQAVDEMNEISARTSEGKEQMMQASIKYLQEISIVESAVSSAHSKLGKLEIDDESGQVFNMLNSVTRLPWIYGSLLVECVRRQEWAEKMTADSSSLVEEMATYKDEEAKRRKKWVKDMDGAVNLEPLDGMALGIEVNVQSQKTKWPKVSRDDITEFVRCLSDAGDMDGALKHVEELVRALDAPSRQQARRAKAFKNGSVHEAAYGRTSLLLRGDEEVLLSMRNEKSKAEDKLKSAESRVRKLEDLLHRQSQMGPFPRPTSAADLAPVNSPTFERYATSPLPNFNSALSKARESGSRRSSVSSRRFPVNNESEEKGLAQRIVGLEADLMKEKTKSADLAKNAAARFDAEELLKSQMREATSTKEDLLGNLEAQQKEFDNERRLLHDEKAMLTLKIEELEDEFDRVLGSREHEDRAHALEEELDQVRMEAASEVEKAHRQVELLQNDQILQRDRIQELERKIEWQSEERASLDQKATQLSLRLENQDRTQTGHHRALRTTLLYLSQEDAPEDFGALIEKVETIAERSAAHLNDIKDALATLRDDNKALNTQIKGQDEEIHILRERLGGEERKSISLREELSMLQKDGESLRMQLEFERHGHDQLKTKFASGETDSEALRGQLAGKENMIAELLSRILQHENQRQDLESQLSERSASLETMQRKMEDLEGTRNAQASRSRVVSERMILHNVGLERLLEHIGLTVTREQERMVIQKAPRASSASTMLTDTSASMKRSVSGPMPIRSDPELSADPELLYWADAEDLEGLERGFGAFMNKVEDFDVDVFNEGVYKRVKEIEHIARKWQREARAYRDKSHRAQSDAHDRIALRNFKEGDLALFLPTRDQATKPWAAFNVGAPHCFLREQDSHNLGKRDWLIARISKVEERVVDLSKSINGGLKGLGDQKSGGDKSDTGAFPNDENPYELSDGLRWYLIDAAEEKPGAPINIGTGKVTVASTNVDAKGSVRMKKTLDGNAATKTLTRSLDSRRSSTNSKKGLVAVASTNHAGPTEMEGMIEQSIDNAAAVAAATSNLEKDNDGHDASETGRPQSSQAQDGPASGGVGPEHVGRISASDS